MMTVPITVSADEPIPITVEAEPVVSLTASAYELLPVWDGGEY